MARNLERELETAHRNCLRAAGLIKRHRLSDAVTELKVAVDHLSELAPYEPSGSAADVLAYIAEAEARIERDAVAANGASVGRAPR